MFPTLETEQLKLREITDSDVSSIFALFSNEQLTKYYGQDVLTDIDQAQAIVNVFANNYKGKRGIRWGIELKETGQLIGTIGFHAWSHLHKRAEIGYEIHPDHWRKGYISEAIQAVLPYGFQQMKLSRIGAIVFLENDASNQLLKKIGFQREGILKKYMVQNGESYDTNVYGLLKEYVSF